MEVQVWLQCNMTILLLVQLTVNMCGLRTALEHIKTCAMQTGVEAEHSLQGWPRWAQTTSNATPHCLHTGTYVKTAQFLPDLNATRSFSRIVLQALKDEWPQRMVGR